VGWVDLAISIAEFIPFIPLLLCTLYLTPLVTSKKELDSDDWETLKTAITKLTIEYGEKEDDFSVEGLEKRKTFTVIVVITLWIAVVFVLAMLILQVVAALKLLRATKLGTDPKVAIQNAKFWRVVTITLLIIMAILLVLGGAIFSLELVGLLIYLPFIWIVQSYIKELETMGSGLPHTQGQVYYYPNPATVDDSEIGGQGKAASEWGQPYVVATSSADMPPSYYETTEKVG